MNLCAAQALQAGLFWAVQHTQTCFLGPPSESKMVSSTVYTGTPAYVRTCQIAAKANCYNHSNNRSKLQQPHSCCYSTGFCCSGASNPHFFGLSFFLSFTSFFLKWDSSQLGLTQLGWINSFFLDLLQEAGSHCMYLLWFLNGCK